MRAGACVSLFEKVVVVFFNSLRQGLSIASSHPSSHLTCVTCQAPSLLHPLKITCDLRQHAYIESSMEVYVYGGRSEACENDCLHHFHNMMNMMAQKKKKNVRNIHK